MKNGFASAASIKGCIAHIPTAVRTALLLAITAKMLISYALLDLRKHIALMMCLEREGTEDLV
jgi:hypothetical protein